MEKSAAVRPRTSHNYAVLAQSARVRHHKYCRSSINLRLLLVVSLLSAGMILFLSGCYGETRAAASGTAQVVAAAVPKLDDAPIACLGWPKISLLLSDQSGSTRTSRTEHPGVERLDSMIDCAKRHGGVIFVGVVRDRSNQPFARLLVEPAPHPPPPLKLTENPLADFDHAAERVGQEQRYLAAHQAWSRATARKVQQFRRDAQLLLAQPATAKATDLVTAVDRAYVAFAQPTPFPWLKNAERVLIVVSDGDDTVATQQVAAPAFPLVTIIVNGSGQVGDLTALHPVRFESFNAMLNFVTGGHHAE